MDADKPAQRKSYAGNTTLEIFEVLWRHSYFGHGLTVRQILDELARKHQLEDPSELPTEKTIRNQLKKGLRVKKCVRNRGFSRIDL